METIRRVCQFKNKITHKQMQEYQTNGFSDDLPTKCYVRCFFEGFQFFDEKSGFNTQNFLSQVANGEEIRFQVESCVDDNKEKSDPCTWAFRIVMCIFSKRLVVSFDTN